MRGIKNWPATFESVALFVEYTTNEEELELDRPFWRDEDERRSGD